MFGNNYNNNSNDANVNTSIKTFYCELSCLTIGYWKDNLSVKLNPFLSKAEDGTRKYDFEKRINTAISQEKAAALAEEIKTTFLPILGTEITAPVSRGIPVGKDSAVCIDYENDEKGIPSMYLTIHTGIGSDKTPAETLRYKFNKTEVTEDYNPKTGTGKDSYVEGEFLVLYRKLVTLPDILGTAAHSVKYDNEKSSKYNPSSQGGNQRPQQAGGNQYSAPFNNNAGDDNELPWNN